MIKDECKLNVRVTQEFNERFRAVAKKYGLTLNQLGNMCIQAGLRNVLRALEPEQSFSDEQWGKIFKVMSELGSPEDFKAGIKGVEIEGGGFGSN